MKKTIGNVVKEFGICVGLTVLICGTIYWVITTIATIKDKVWCEGWARGWDEGREYERNPEKDDDRWTTLNHEIISKMNFDKLNKE